MAVEARGEATATELARRLVGGWGQQRGGGVAFLLLEDAGAAAATAVETDAARLETWLSGVRVLPAFPAPLERELAGR